MSAIFRSRLIAMMLVGGSAFSAPFGRSEAADAEYPTVVELYQSQGCSSCPPANANLNAIADRPDVLALSFAITYWDRLGWPDTFAKPAFTDRQWDYAKAGARKNVYTPQMVINGSGVIVGNRKNEIEASLAKLDRGRSGPSISATESLITIGEGETNSPADVWFVSYDPRVRNVAIKAGENGGRTLPHKNIVHEIRLIGKWTGAEATFRAPASDAPYRAAILVQQGRGGPIIAARKI